MRLAVVEGAFPRLGLLLSAVLTVAANVSAAPLTPGNLVIYRMGDGAAALAATGTAVFLDEYTTAGVLVQSIAVPTTTVATQRRLVGSGSATSEGFLTRSTDGQYVVFSGYDAALLATITTSTSAAVPRVIGRLAANGTLDTSTALTDAISGGNPRSAASTNGTDLWISGTSGGGGVRYATLGATTSTSLSTTLTNLRAIGIFGGQLYTSSASGAFRLATVGTGTPTTTGQTITNLPGFPTAVLSPYAFFFADLDAGVAGVDTVYVADEGGTINKYSLVSGAWTANGTIAVASARGLTGTVSGSSVTLYITARTTLRTLTDTSGYNATITGSPTTLATAATNTAMQGVAFVPVAIAATPTLTISDVSQVETDAGTTTFTFNVNLSSAAGASGVTFDVATADGTAQDDTPATEDNDYTALPPTGLSISAGNLTKTFDVTVNGDTTPETNETFFVNVTNVVGATVGDSQGQGTITNDDFVLTFIHDVQGSGAASPVAATTVKVEGVVVANFQGTSKLQGFFLEEEDVDADANPLTSEGIFVFCGACATAVAEGQRVRVVGTVSEFFDMTEITASTAASVVVTEAGNHLAEVTPAAIDLPVAGDVNAFYEAREGMLVTFVDTLTVSEYFELARFGQLELFEGGRPYQFTETALPSVAGNTAHLAALDRRRVILDDDDNGQESFLSLPDGSQAVFYPQANGGFSVGTQGTDFFRGGDLVNGLTGVLHWSFPGSGADTWRIRPTAAHPVTFTVANPRPVTPPAVSGAIKAVSMNLLNYFTTIDTTASNSTGPCSPSGTLDCRGADSTAELSRQRDRASVVVCSLNADVYGFMELENTTPSATITDLLGAINARCGGAHPYAFVNTGGTLGTDAIRVQLIYRTGVVSPVGSPLVDLDPVHNRPPTAQTFDVVDAANPAFGARFTVIANHFKSKGCPGTGADADAGDGQSCFNGTRVAQAARLLTWINATVLPAAGDPDVLLLGDFNSYAQEDPVTTLTNGGFIDVETALLGSSAYSYLFDGQLGHLDYAFASASLFPNITGVGAWHINADEAALFDYNDEVFDSPGEASFDEKPDGSALVPPRVVFQPATPYRASDHDPVLVGLFPVADLTLTKIAGTNPVPAGDFLTYTMLATNNGPDAATTVELSDVLPPGTTFVSLISPLGWTCTTPAVGSNGTVTCTIASFAVGSASFSLKVAVSAALGAGTTIDNTAAITSGSIDSDTSGNFPTASTTVSIVQIPGMTLTKTTSATSYTAVGDVLPYALVAKNTGTVILSNVVISDPLLPTLACTPAQPATLAPGASLSCTGSHTIVAADLLNGFVTNTATATGQGLGSDTLFGVVEERLGVDEIARTEAVLVTVTANGTVTVFAAAPGVTGTRLALATCSLDLQQDWSPRFTKLQFEVWNEDEVKFTGAFECADSWHETDFGASIDAAQQNFTIGVLGTFGGRYRVQAVTSTQCTGAQAAGLLGVQSTFLSPNPNAVGTTLVGAGKFTGAIRWDPRGTVPEGGIR